MWLIESASEFVANVLWRNLAQTIEHEARMDAYRHVQRLELAWFEDQSTGGLLSILNDDVNQLERFLDIGANELVRTFVNVVFVGVVFFVAEPVLGVVAFLPIPIIVWGSIRYQRRLEPRYTVVRQAAGDLGALLANNVSGIATIRAFTAEERESERVAAASGTYREANREAIRLSSAFIPLIRLAILAAFTLTLLIGGRAALNGTLEVGVFSVLVYMTQRLLWPLTRLGETFDLYQRAMASTRRILDLLAVDPTIVDGVLALPAPVRGEVRFESVRFAYGPSPTPTVVGTGDGERPRRPVLDAFDLVVPPGETHAIVGSTGAGKSTVVKLLLRLYDTTPAASPSTVSTCAACRWPSCDAPSATSARTCSCSRARSARTSPTAVPMPATPSSSGPPAWPRRTTSSSSCPTATTRSLASGARSCRAASDSDCRSPGRSSRIRRCWCSTRPLRRSTTRPRRPSSVRSSWSAAIAP